MALAEEARPMTEQDFVRVVYDASYRRLVVQLLALCGDQAEAEDLVQEAFVKAVRRSREFAQLDNPKAWLRTVAVNELRHRWRHARVFRRIMPKVPGMVHVVELTPDHVAVVDALSQLNFELRQVITLHHIADMSTADVARALSIPEGTVKTRLVRARALLAGLLSDREEPHHA